MLKSTTWVWGEDGELRFRARRALRTAAGAWGKEGVPAYLMGPALNQRPGAHSQQVDAVSLQPHGYLVVDVEVDHVLWKAERRGGNGGEGGGRGGAKFEALTQRKLHKAVVDKVCFGALAVATIGNRRRSSSGSRARHSFARDTRGSGCREMLESRPGARSAPVSKPQVRGRTFR